MCRISPAQLLSIKGLSVSIQYLFYIILIRKFEHHCRDYFDKLPPKLLHIETIIIGYAVHALKYDSIYF